LFQAYPSQRPRRKTRNNPYLRPEEPEVATPAGNMNPDVEDNDVEIVSMDNIVPTMPVVPEQVAGIHQEATPEKEPEKPVVKTATVARLKKKVVPKKKTTQKSQPSIAAHLPLYNVVADLQQQRANITFGQLLQLSPRLRSDVGRSLRKPGTRNPKIVAQFVDNIARSATALYCDAEVRGRSIPLILDSGASGSIVSCQLLNDLGLGIDRPSTTVMINVHGERKRPLGEVTNFPITIQGITIPVDIVVVTDAQSYSAIVGNDWLSKVNALIDYQSSMMTITWRGQELRVPVEYLEMPIERRDRMKKQEEAAEKEKAPEEVKKTVKEGNENEREEDDIGEEEEEMSEEESDYEEEYEEERDLEEKVFCHWEADIGDNRRQCSGDSDKPLRLTCTFDEVVTQGIYTREDFVLTNEGVYIGGSFCHWNYFDRLEERFKEKPPENVSWVFDWKGPSSRCWCQTRMYSPSHSCDKCQDDLTNYLTLKSIAFEIIEELSSGNWDDLCPPEEERQEVLIPQTYNQVILKKVTEDQDRRSCFHCGRKSHLEWKEYVTATPSSEHKELSEPEQVEYEGLSIGNLAPEEWEKFNDMLVKDVDMFAWDPNQLGKTNLVQHSIDVGNATPIKKRWYLTSRTERAFIEEEIQRMLQQGLIERAKGPWASPVVLARKKNGKLRFCVDYRALNKVTKKDEYPLPRIEEMLDSLGGSTYFTSLDLASGYWQVEMKPEDREKTAFITQFGTFQFKVMPFGLCNAPATFQRLMDEVLQGILWDYVVVYLDDLNIYSRNFDEHLLHLRAVFDRLRRAGLKLNPDKCRFVTPELVFLGHVIDQQGVRTDPEKIEKVKNFPIPKNLTQLRSFLGLASYYRKFIKNFSKIAGPLNKLMKKGMAFQWAPQQQQAFIHLKECLVTSPILVYPDWTKEFILFTDASTFALGAVLAQRDKENQDHVVAYASRSLLPAEKNYSATELECLAVVWAIKKFHHYLHGKHFLVITDHSALCHLFNVTTPNGRLAR